MELRIGYFPVLDAALVLRQAYDFVRFQPFNPLMESCAGRLSAGDRALVEATGEATRGWLEVIEALLDPGDAGLLGLEEGLVRLDGGDLEAAGTSLAAARPLLAQVLRTDLAPEASRRARHLLEAAEAIARGIRKDGLWAYVLGLSDRVRRGRNGELEFRIKPELRVREEDLERVIVMPSLVLSRQMAFWKSGATLLLYVSMSAPLPVDGPPESLLLSAMAVGDRTRLRMLRYLAGRSCTNLEMAGLLGVNPSTASRHFKLFKNAGFVELREGEGGRSEYELASGAIVAALGAIADYITCA